MEPKSYLLPSNFGLAEGAGRPTGLFEGEGFSQSAPLAGYSQSIWPFFGSQGVTFEFSRDFGFPALNISLKAGLS